MEQDRSFESTSPPYHSRSMQMSSLESRFVDLERKLKKQPLKLNPIKSLPFLIFHYEPGDEWKRVAKTSGFNWKTKGKRLFTSQWKGSSGVTEGHRRAESHRRARAIVELEKDSGFLEAQDQIVTYFPTTIAVRSSRGLQTALKV